MSAGPRDRANWWGLKCRMGKCHFAPNLLFGPIGAHCLREGCDKQVIVEGWPPKRKNWPFPEPPPAPKPDLEQAS